MLQPIKSGKWLQRFKILNATLHAKKHHVFFVLTLKVSEAILEQGKVAE